MKEVTEVKSDFTDEQNYTFIDVFFDDNPDSEGKSVCAVCNDTHKVLFFDNLYRTNEKVIMAIGDVLSTLKKA